MREGGGDVGGVGFMFSLVVLLVMVEAVVVSIFVVLLVVLLFFVSVVGLAFGCSGGC